MSYATEVLADGPLGFWLLDETTGTVATDSSGNGRHGTYNGAPALAADTVADLTSPTFDGVDDYVSLPAINVGGGPYTVEVVARCDVIVPLSEVVSEIWDGGGDRIMASIGLKVAGEGADAQITGGAYSGSGWRVIQAGLWTAGDSHHLAYTYDGATSRFYVDGAFVGSQGYSPFESNSGWRIGRQYSGAPYWNGSIAGVALYNTALSEERVTAHRDALFPAPPPSADLPPYASEVLADHPLGLWLLDETSGTVATDSSGNGHHGTYVGSPSLAATTMAKLAPTPVFVDDQVTIPAIDVGTGPYTLEAVARMDVGVRSEVFAEGFAGGDNGILAAIGINRDAVVETNDRIQGTSYTGSQGSPGFTWYNSTAGPWTPGDVHHLAYVFDGTTSRLYVDGVVTGTIHTRNSFNSNNGWFIGGQEAGRWKGSIGGVALYSRALSASRVTAHYEAISVEPGIPVEAEVPLHVGADQAVAIYVGDAEVQAIYMGESLTYTAEELS